MPETKPQSEFSVSTVASTPPQVHSPKGASAEREFTVREKGLAEQVVRRFLRHRLAVASLIVFLILVLFAFVGPLVWKWNYAQLTPQFNTGPSADHPLGTDTIGHDVLAQIMRGTQHSLLITFLLTLISITGGTLIGSMAGFYRGVFDSVVMRICDLILTIPVLAIAAALGASTGGTWASIALILGALAVPYVARLVRGVVLSLREKEYIEAARALGASNTRIILRHLVPNALGPILVLATISVAAGVLAEAGLSAIGFGVQTPDTSLGLQIQQAVNTISTHPLLFYIPGIFIITIALTINFIGDGLRDAFDPRQTRVRQ